MSTLTNQRVAYFNGKIVPDSEARVSIRDRGCKYWRCRIRHDANI